MGNNDVNLQSDILYFDRKENKRIKMKDCEIINDFIFSRNNFFLVYKKGVYFICIPHDGDLISLWHKIAYENKKKIPSGEVISEFRKNYLKNGIEQKDIDFFIADPLAYEANKIKEDNKRTFKSKF